MSDISIPIPDMEASLSEQAAPIVQAVEMSANEMYGYGTCMSKEDAIQKRLFPIDGNVRNRIPDFPRTKYLF